MDVIVETPSNGDTLVYNSVLNKYEVKALPTIITELDGGSF